MILCQFLSKTDYVVAFAMSSTSFSSEAWSGLYEFVWDVTILEYLVNHHTAKGELAKRDVAVSLSFFLDVLCILMNLLVINGPSLFIVTTTKASFVCLYSLLAINMEKHYGMENANADLYYSFFVCMQKFQFSISFLATACKDMCIVFLISCFVFLMFFKS